MPLREHLLQPVSPEDPGGSDLRYDKVFDQLKDARIEDDDSLPSGAWGRSIKKADRVLVLRLAGDILTTRSKDLRVAGWYLESLLRREGFSQLPAGLEFFWKLQTEFWESVHPRLEEGGNADLRVAAVETAVNLLAASVKAVPLTRGGINLPQFLDAQAVGIETDDMSGDKREAREEAIAEGRMTGEDLQKSVDVTPKAFYVETEGHLVRGLEILAGMDEFQKEKYGDDYPSVARLKSAIEDVKHVVSGVLYEKRKTDPDPVSANREPEPDEEAHDAFAKYDQPADDFADDGVSEDAEPAPAPPEERAKILSKRRAPVGVLTDENSAYQQIAAAAEFLRTLNSGSPVPYLLCSALRLGETRCADLSDSSFPVAPPTETRQALRRLANEGNWDELAQLCLRSMAEPYGRVWLDLQRYAWRAAVESTNASVATAVVSNLRALLTDLPEVRGMMMDDDTPVANSETNAWIDSEVLSPAPEPATAAACEEPEPPVYEPPVYKSATAAEGGPPDIYETALEVLKRGRVAEAISLLVRDSELQPSGRMRFHRRVQMAELCLAADQAAVAYPVLVDLSGEMERRALETWESGEMLAQPLGLLLRCLDKRNGSAEEREAIFDRLCRLDPQAALTLGR